MTFACLLAGMVSVVRSTGSVEGQLVVALMSLQYMLCTITTPANMWMGLKHELEFLRHPVDVSLR